MTTLPDYRPALSAQLRQSRRAVAETSPAAFAAIYLAHHFVQSPSRMHRELFETLARISTQRPSRVAIAAPRGHAKTTVVSLAYVLWSLLYRREEFVVLVAASREQAIGYLKALKAELSNNPLLLEDFPEATVPPEGPRVRPWTDTQIVLPSGPCVRALGAEQRMRGLKHRQHRPSLIIADDLEEQEQTASSLQRRKLREWFEGTLLKMSEPRTNVVVVGTILHYDSLLAKLVGATTSLAQDRISGWEGQLYRAIEAFSERPELWDRWEAIYSTRQEHQGATGPQAAAAFLQENRDEMLRGTRVLWPQRESYEELMVLKHREGRASFQAEKQNEPLDPQECLFPEESLLYWDDSGQDVQTLLRELGPTARIYGAWDPSLGRSGGQGDYSAILTLVEHPKTRVLYVILADIALRTPAQSIDRIVELARIFRYRDFAVESNGFQEVLIDRLRQRASANGVHLYVRPVQHSTDKKGRIQALQPLIATGRVRFSRRHGTLLEQLRQFPLGAHDDGPDALEMAVRLADKGSYSVARVFT